jgi:hypothetical protein
LQENEKIKIRSKIIEDELIGAYYEARWNYKWKRC